MRLGIDASNLRAGGGLTHLVQLLRAANPPEHGFRQVMLWGGSASLARIEDRPWLVKAYNPVLDKGLLHRSFWQRFKLSKLARQNDCDVLFVPGGSFAGDFHPVVTMSRNLLPFEWQEMRRYGLSWQTMKCLLLRRTQSDSFRRADGLIFLTRYAQEAVTRVTGPLRGKIEMIPHGIDEHFVCAPRSSRAVQEYSVSNPFRLLYVSIVDTYKHQWNVTEAVARLRADRLPVTLDLVGPAYGPALERLLKVIERVDPGQAFVRYRGPVPHQELHHLYRGAELFVFASSCENMPNILLEAMASGLPVACSDRGPMPEVLGDGGGYFDPEDIGGITQVIRHLIESPALRAEKAQVAFERAKSFSWERCADETFRFLRVVAGPSGQVVL